MPRHSLYPGFIRIHYTSNTHPHVQVLPINADPTAVGDSFTIPTRGSGAVDWQDATDAYAILLAAFLDGAASVDYAELYNFEADPAPADFLASHPLNVAGSGAGSPVEWSQVVMPFKGLAGASVRPYVMEGLTPVDTKQSFAAIDSPTFCNYLEFILSADDWVAMRGGGFPLVSLGYVSKTNDQLRKRYFVP